MGLFSCFIRVKITKIKLKNIYFQVSYKTNFIINDKQNRGKVKNDLPNKELNKSSVFSSRNYFVFNFFLLSYESDATILKWIARET